ncbi:MAG: hypothetical protein K6G00_00475 [Treponema sp.]|nr:hypothetical protein [Treponema sp.]
MRKLLEEKPNVLTAIRIPEDTVDIAPSVLSHKEFSVMDEDLFRIQLQYVGDFYRIIWQSSILDTFTMCCIKCRFFFPAERTYRKLAKLIDAMDNEKLRSLSEKKKGTFYQFRF